MLETDRRIGMYSATSVVAIDIAYVTTGLIGLAARPPDAHPLRQVDPYLAILEYFIILVATLLVVLMAAVYRYAAPGRRIYGVVALCFMVAFATLTCSVHFVSLTAGRQIESSVFPQLWRQVSLYEWPSLALAVEFLAWHFFFGLAMLFAALVWQPARTYVRISMLTSGALCLLSTLGPLTGEMRIPWLGIAGYAFLLPVACVFLAVLFRRTTAEDR